LHKDKANPESRLVAYYCRQYAVHTGIPLAISAPGKTCLGEFLLALEQEKMAMDTFSREEAKFLCRKFADKIFDRADLEDQAGDANKNTATTFYAAVSFLEILQLIFKMTTNRKK
jgi:vacuolar protein sorting-associated protein VTA1